MKWLYLGTTLILLILATQLIERSTALRTKTGPTLTFGSVGSMLAALAMTALALIALNKSFPLFNLQPRRTWGGIVYAAVALPVLYYMLAKKVAPWVFLPLLAFFIIPQFNPDFTPLFHGFMHVSFVYECLLRGLPPENPLMGGETLHYMYGFHAVIAWLLKVVPISPSIAFALTDGVLLVAFAIVVERIARRISLDPVYRVLAVVLSLFGVDIFLDGPVAGFANALVGPRRFGAVSALQKFTGINTNQVGLLCSAVALLAIVRLAAREPNRITSYLMLALTTVCAAMLYQPSWIAIGAIVGTAAAAAFVLRLKEFRLDAWMILAVFAAASAFAAPILLGAATGGNPADPPVKLLYSLRHLYENSKFWLMHILMPFALLYFAREQLLQQVRRIPAVFGVLALGVIALHGMYLLVYLRFNNEYKLLLSATLPLALLAAIGLKALLETHKRLGLLALFLLLVPAVTDFTYVTQPQLETDHVISDGVRTRHRQIEEDALYSWVWDKTETSAIFIDSLLTVPPLGGRQLFVGLDIGRDPGLDRGDTHNGWLIHADTFLKGIIDVDPQKYAQRKHLATELLTGSAPVSSGLVEQLHRAVPGKPLYVITRTPAQRQRVSGVPGAHVVYDNATRTVFRLDS